MPLKQLKKKLMMVISLDPENVMQINLLKELNKSLNDQDVKTFNKTPYQGLMSAIDQTIRRLSNQI